jgi:hypothetical protein
MIGQENNPAVNKHFKLQIKTLQNAPTDADKLEQLLKAKEGEKQRVCDLPALVSTTRSKHGYLTTKVILSG